MRTVRPPAARYEPDASRAARRALIVMCGLLAVANLVITRDAWRTGRELDRALRTRLVTPAAWHAAADGIRIVDFVPVVAPQCTHDTPSAVAVLVEAAARATRALRG